jgi:hypothetical protein
MIEESTVCDFKELNSDEIKSLDDGIKKVLCGHNYEYRFSSIGHGILWYVREEFITSDKPKIYHVYLEYKRYKNINNILK